MRSALFRLFWFSCAREREWKVFLHSISRGVDECFLTTTWIIHATIAFSCNKYINVSNKELPCGSFGKNRVCELFPRISQKCHFAKSHNASWYDDITQIPCTHIEIYCILSHRNHQFVQKDESGQNIVGHQTPLLVDLVPAPLSMALQ